MNHYIIAELIYDIEKDIRQNAMKYTHKPQENTERKKGKRKALFTFHGKNVICESC